MLIQPQGILTWILLGPLVAAAINLLFFRRNGEIAVFVSVGSALIGMMLAFYTLLNLPTAEGFIISWSWLTLEPLNIRIGYFYNDMAATMLFVVSFVGFWIHVFSVGYMKDDENRGRYFTGLSIFMFSMLGIVLADNLFMIFIFWELVGFSSYLLIAHYWTTEEASNASKKAFIMNRVGDFGMLLGIIWTYWHFGTVNLVELAQIVEADHSMIVGGIGLLLMCGFIGKSAQFPLHTWLPDAMAGPTPVSALIHAATMVAAGIYFIGRVFFLFDETTLSVIMWLGAGMAVFAGLLAFGQRDIKKILAYSTLSQLGYMAAAVGLGYPGLALFHTATHGFFKALLFLGAGSVIHACHHEQDIFKMGGLLKRMPVTSATFAIGTLALCGVTFFSGYWSKDAIIEVAYFDGNTPIFALLMFGALLTSAYMARLFIIAFMGKPKSKKAERATESSGWMVIPLLVLAVLSLLGGFERFWPDNLSTLFANDLHYVHEGIKHMGDGTMFFILGIVTWAGGFAFSTFFYRVGANEDRLEKTAPALYIPAREKLWFDDIYTWYVTNVQDRLASLLHFFDMVLIGGLLVRGSAGVAALFGLVAKSVNFGNIQVYAYWFFGGLVLFWAFAMKYIS